MRNSPHHADVDARPTMHFVPFEQMTAAEQAEHLVRAHGYDAEWMRYDPGQQTDEEVVVWFRDQIRADRAMWHNDDHAEFEHGGATRYLHTHGKRTRR